MLHRIHHYNLAKELEKYKKFSNYVVFNCGINNANDALFLSISCLICNFKTDKNIYFKNKHRTKIINKFNKLLQSTVHSIFHEKKCKHTMDGFIACEWGENWIGHYQIKGNFISGFKKEWSY